jgi:hypothetical protein
VTVGVVDLFEAVEVEQQQRERGTVPFGVGEDVRGTPLELAAVRQVRERVEAGALDQVALLDHDRRPGRHQQHERKAEDQQVETDLVLRQLDRIVGRGDDEDIGQPGDLGRGLADPVLDHEPVDGHAGGQERRRPHGDLALVGDGLGRRDRRERHGGSVDADRDHRVERRDARHVVDRRPVGAGGLAVRHQVVVRAHTGAGTGGLGVGDRTHAERRGDLLDRLGDDCDIGAGQRRDLDRIDDRRHLGRTDLSGGPQSEITGVGGFGAAGEEPDRDRDDEHQAQHQRRSPQNPHADPSDGGAPRTRPASSSPPRLCIKAPHLTRT